MHHALRGHEHGKGEASGDQQELRQPAGGSEASGRQPPRPCAVGAARASVADRQRDRHHPSREDPDGQGQQQREEEDGGARSLDPSGLHDGPAAFEAPGHHPRCREGRELPGHEPQDPGEPMPVIVAGEEHGGRDEPHDQQGGRDRDHRGGDRRRSRGALDPARRTHGRDRDARQGEPDDAPGEERQDGLEHSFRSDRGASPASHRQHTDLDAARHQDEHPGGRDDGE